MHFPACRRLARNLKILRPDPELLCTELLSPLFCWYFLAAFSCRSCSPPVLIAAEAGAVGGLVRQWVADRGAEAGSAVEAVAEDLVDSAEEVSAVAEQAAVGEIRVDGVIVNGKNTG